MTSATLVVRHLLDLMRGYAAARSERFKDHRLHQTVRDIRSEFEQVDFVKSRRSIKVRASVGMGNWAVVPWVAFLDSRETATTQDGVYVIILFRADMSGLYVTLNQGITKPMGRFGRADARAALRGRAFAIRARFPDLQDCGFDVGTPLDLKAQRNFTAGLDDSTIAHRFFTRDDLEKEDAFMTALQTALDIYERYLTAPLTLEIDRDVSGV